MDSKRSDSRKSYQCNKEVLRALREKQGWTQARLAEISGYSERLIVKAEAGLSISLHAIETLAEALSTGSQQVYPEDLICDPVQSVRELIAAWYRHQRYVLPIIRHQLDDQITFRFAGDPELIPFAGTYRGHSEVQRAISIFFDVLECPRGHDPSKCYEILCQATTVFVWGQSWLHPIGRPLASPIEVRHLLRFRRGKILEFDYCFDTLKGAQIFQGMHLLNPPNANNKNDHGRS